MWKKNFYTVLRKYNKLMEEKYIWTPPLSLSLSLSPSLSLFSVSKSIVQGFLHVLRISFHNAFLKSHSTCILAVIKNWADRVNFRHCPSQTVSISDCVNFRQCLFQTVSISDSVYFRQCLFQTVSISDSVNFRQCPFHWYITRTLSVFPSVFPFPPCLYQTEALVMNDRYV